MTLWQCYLTTIKDTWPQ